MFIAEVTFWGQEKGGRFTPPQSGFRPQILAGDVKTSCAVTSVEDRVTTFEFNKPYLVKLELMFPNEYGNALSVDGEVALFEGNKQIAAGKILSESN